MKPHRSGLLAALLILVNLAWLAAPAAAQAGAQFRYFRFTDWVLRDSLDGTFNPAAEGPQFSEVVFFNGDDQVGDQQSITASNNDGQPGPSEQPENVLDSNVNTKWYDTERANLVFDFGDVVTIDRFQLSTANDVADRDPVGWRFQGSNDNVTWTTVDLRQMTGDYLDTGQMPTDRLTQGEVILFNSVNRPPEVTFTAIAGGVRSGEALNVAPGTMVSLQWDGGALANAATLDIGQGPQTVAISGSRNITISAAQTVTFRATSGGGAAEETIQFFVGAQTQAVQINELFPNGTLAGAVLCDRDGDPSDWLEINNPNPFAISLANYRVTNASVNSGGLVLPAGTQIEGNGQLVLFASGKASSAGELHLPFNLDNPNQTISVFAPGGNRDDQFNSRPAVPENVSYGRTSSGGFDFFTQPTPNAANTTPPGPLGPEVIFSETSQTFTGTLGIRLDSAGASGQIRYTLDGTIPTETNGLTAQGTFGVASSTIVRARVLAPGFAPGPVRSESYSRIDNTVANTARTLPVVVIENFDNGAISSSPQFQPAAFSLYEAGPDGQVRPQGVPSVSSRVGIRQSQNSDRRAKLSLDLRFYQDGSDAPRDLELFNFSADSEWILYAPYTFDTSLIRTPFINELANAAGYKVPQTRLVEVYLNTSGGISFGSGVAEPSNDYYGVYVLMERPTINEERLEIEALQKNDRSAEDTTGGYVLRIDDPSSGGQAFFSTRGYPLAVNGINTRPAYIYDEPAGSELSAVQRAAILEDLDAWETALFDGDDVTRWQDLMDLDAAIDYNLFSTFIKDPDAFRTNAFLYQPQGGKLTFGPLFQSERGLAASNDSRSWRDTQWLASGERADPFEYLWWREFFRDQDFGQLWVDRWWELRDGVMANEAMQDRIAALAQQVMTAQVTNFARWPARTPNNQESRGQLDFSGAAGGANSWQEEVDHLSNWVARRADWIDSRLGLRPPILQDGAVVTAGTTVEADSVNGIGYYTTNGEDPRSPGGMPNPDAVRFTGRTNIAINQDTVVKVRSQGPSQAGKFEAPWTAMTTETFLVGGTAASNITLAITELMYHPAEPSTAESAVSASRDDYEFIELRNLSSQTLKLAGVRISGEVTFEFPAGATLPPNGAGVLVSNRAAFLTRYSTGQTILGEYGGKLSDGGGRLIFRDLAGNPFYDFTYDDDLDLGWATVADGTGRSLVLDMPLGMNNLNEAAVWRGSLARLGTPGEVFTDFFAEFTAAFFPGQNNQNVVGETADPDGDGLGNLLEIGLGLDPTVPNTAPMTPVAIQNLTVNGTRSPYAVISFEQASGLGGVVVVAEFSTLLRPETFSANGVLMRRVDLGNGRERVSYRFPTPFTGGRLFARVRVSR